MRPWLEALKAWNEKKDVWCIPKRGTKAYNEVIAIMEDDVMNLRQLRDRKLKGRKK